MIKPDFNEGIQCFEGIFSITNQGIFVIDHEGIVLRVNPAFTKILGYKENEIVGKPFYILTSKDKFKQESISYSPLNRFYGAEKSSMEDKFYDKTGQDVPIRFRSFIIRDEHGQVARAVGIIEQIVEVTRTGELGSSLAEKMWEAQQNFENVLENSADAVLMCDNSGNITMANNAFLHMLNYTQEEVVGTFIVNFTAIIEGTYATTAGEELIIDEECVKNTGSKSAELYEKGYIKNWETYFVRKDKVHVPVEATLSMLKDEEGERRGSIVILRDITERRKTEVENKKSGNFLENIFKTTADGILVTNDEGTITMANESLEKILGYSKGELLGKHTKVLMPEGKKHLEIAEEQLTILFEKGVVTSFECEYLKKDGRLIKVEVNSALLKNEKGNVTGAVSSIRDITERKEIEHKLLQSEKLKSLGELSGGVAHDFNNVLAAILGRVQLLKMQFTPPEGIQEKRKAMIDLIKSLEIIERASLDGAETVRRIQEFSRKRADDRNFTQVNINELLENVLEFTSVRWKDAAESKGIKIKINKEFSSLPPTAGSASELREVFTNIVNNAIDAMPQGGRLALRTLTENNHIAINIEDTGIGIPKDIQNRIFDPFFTTKGVQSTGLGMSTSYGIINRHKGTILVNSSEGKGTTFTIKLPLSEEKIKEKGMPEQEEKEHRRAKILVIEDEEGVRQLLYDILTSGGHEVQVAPDGNQGLKLFETGEFDLVFTDLGMPDMSGWEVAESINSINSRIPVAIITGWNIELDELEMKERGVNLIAHKPFEVNQVLQLVLEGMKLRDQLKVA